MVIGLLLGIAIGIFALERLEPDYAPSAAPPLQPLSHEAVAGQDNSALAIKVETPAAAGSAAVAAMPKNGTEMFEQTCSVCHGQGIAGAPKAGDKAAWGPRIAEGNAVLYEHALKGFQGKTGVM